MNQPSLYTRFSATKSSNWHTGSSGNGSLQMSAHGLRLANNSATERHYTNAQIDDYHGLVRADFPWRPPLCMTLRARFSHDSGHLTGTAGFGFWNDPFRLGGRLWPTLPQALWFFYAGPDSDMPLSLDQQGWGWKASLLDARTPRFLATAPVLALAAPTFCLPPLCRLFRPAAQNAASTAGLLLPPSMRQWHIYTIDWQRTRVQFLLDGHLILETSHVPAGPLGLVVWLDNQYLQLSPWGRFRWGLLAKEETQWLEIDWLAIENGAS